MARASLAIGSCHDVGFMQFSRESVRRREDVGMRKRAAGVRY
jgi:hypothetical protein